MFAWNYLLNINNKIITNESAKSKMCLMSEFLNLSKLKLKILSYFLILILWCYSAISAIRQLPSSSIVSSQIEKQKRKLYQNDQKNLLYNFMSVTHFLFKATFGHLLICAAQTIKDTHKRGERRLNSRRCRYLITKVRNQINVAVYLII